MKPKDKSVEPNQGARLIVRTSMFNRLGTLHAKACGTSNPCSKYPNVRQPIRQLVKHYFVAKFMKPFGKTGVTR